MSDEQPTIYVRCMFDDDATGIHIRRARVKVFSSSLQIEFHLKSTFASYVTERISYSRSVSLDVWTCDGWNLLRLNAWLNIAFDELVGSYEAGMT